MTLKVLWYSDFLCTTGFGNVAHEIVRRLMKETKTVAAVGLNTTSNVTVPKYEFTVLGINHFGEPYNVPSSRFYEFRNIPVYPSRTSMKDWLGRNRLVELLNEQDFDVLFVLQDTFNMVPMHDVLYDLCAKKQIRHVFYFPVDAHLDPLWVSHAVNTAHVPVAYTRSAAAEAERLGAQGVRVVCHGTDTEVFYPMEPEERTAVRADMFNCGPDDFLLVNVNRNQPRKDLPRTILAWQKLRESRPGTKLYLHTDVNDAMGSELMAFVHIHVKPEYRNDILWPQSLGDGFSLEDMRKVYCAADVVVSTTLGEGWGLSTTEAMACKTPVVMPRHTALEEIVGPEQERGWLVELDGFYVLPKGDNFRIRPLTSVESFVSAVQAVQANPELAQQKAEAALAWVKENCDWDRIAERWDEILSGGAG